MYGHNDEIMVAPDTGVFICCQKGGIRVTAKAPKNVFVEDWADESLFITGGQSFGIIRLRSKAWDFAPRFVWVKELPTPSPPPPSPPASPAARLRMRSVSRAWRA